MAKPSIRVERDAICVYVENVRVVAVGTRDISLGQRHFVIDKTGVVTEVIAVGVLGSLRISSDGTGEIAITPLNGGLAAVSARIRFSAATGHVEKLHLEIGREIVLVGATFGVTLESTLRPLSFNGQMLFHGQHMAKATLFGKTILSHTLSRPLGLHDSIDALSLLSAGYLDPTENPNIKAFLERIKRTKDGDVPGLSSLSAPEIATLLTLLRSKTPGALVSEAVRGEPAI